MRAASRLAASLAMSLLPLDLGAQSGAYRTTQDGHQLAAEVYHWVGRTLEATADVPLAGHRIVTRTVYDSAYEPLSYEIHIHALATGAELRAVQVTFGDSVRWTVAGQGGGGALALPAPRAVMQNLLWSHLAAVARRLPPRGDATLTLHTFLVDNAAALDLTLASRGGRLTASVAGTEVVLARAADGDLDSAAVPGQRLRIERVPPESVSASRPIVPQTPVAPPGGVTEEPFAWTDGAQRLEGTLALPARAGAKLPVILIIAGSGPTDRDGNNPLGVRSDLYKKLAWGLAQRGIATLRYDKRGIGASAFTGDVARVTFGDFADDAAAGARALAADARFTKVILLGHSEGALLAVRAANLGAPAAGVVMMAGVGRPLTTVLREQLARSLDSARLAAFDRTVAAYLADGPLPAVDSSLRPLLNPSVRRFLQTESALDPAAEARRVPVPLLVLQGATDVQVAVADAEALRAARPDAEVHVLPETSHMFVHAASREDAAQAPGYRDPAAPLVPELVPLVAAFVRRVTR